MQANKAPEQKTKTVQHLKNVIVHFQVQGHIYEIEVPMITSIADILDNLIKSAKLDNKYKAYYTIYNNQSILKSMHISDLQTGIKARYEITLSKNKPSVEIKAVKIKQKHQTRQINTFLSKKGPKETSQKKIMIKKPSTEVSPTKPQPIVQSSRPLKVEAYDGDIHPNNLFVFTQEKYADIVNWTIKKVRSRIGVKKNAYVITDDGCLDVYEDADIKLQDIFVLSGLSKEKNLIKIQFK